MTKKKILIVDDDKDFLRMLEMSLESNPDYHITSIKDGSAALAEIQQQSFDLLLIDYNLPGANGLVIAEKARDLVPHIPIVLMTAVRMSIELQARVRLLNLAGFLAKPFSLSQLREMLQKNMI